MKKNLHSNICRTAILTVGLILMLTSGIFATNNIHQVIITGQVVNAEFGNPLEMHQVIIETGKNTPESNYYHNIVQTDEEGFFFDTIASAMKSGSMVISTRDYRGEKVESVIYFRFSTPTVNNIFVIDFMINDLSPSPQLQAKFKPVQKLSGERFRFKFIDLTDNEKVTSWQWDLGDGHSSALQNPTHTYKKPGLYKVQLKIKAASDRGNETSKISKLIYIPESENYHIGGHCFADYFPITRGKAFLYRVENENMLIAVDTVIIDTLGYYYFYQVPVGNYSVKTQPDDRSDAYSHLIPTYFGDEAYWEKATTLIHQQTNWEYDIKLVEGKSPTAGNGEIRGKVLINGSSRYGDVDLAAGVDIYLFDENNELLMSHYTDKNHEFVFDMLGMGTYWISPEIAGLPEQKIKVDLTNSSPSKTDIEFNIMHPEFNMYVQESLTTKINEVGLPYPNPASNQLTIEIYSDASSQGVIEVIDLQGKIISHQTVLLNGGLTKTIVQTNTLKNGIYMLIVKSDGIINQRRFVVSR